MCVRAGGGDESDPMVFLDAPVRRSVFLVGDFERIEEVSSSIPRRPAAQTEFAAQEQELAAEETDRASDEFESPGPNSGCRSVRTISKMLRP